MPSIIFLKTKELEKIENFYLERIGMKIWLRQEDCTILKKDNLLLGFCKRDNIDNCGIITFFYKNRECVNKMYYKFKDIAFTKPKINKKYQIYQFFAKDPEERILEFQAFIQPLNP